MEKKLTAYEQLAQAERESAHTIEIEETVTGKRGVANTCVGGVAVYYGNDDGSDDKVVTVRQFNRNFKITAVLKS